MNENKTLSIEEVMEILSVSKSTLAQWRADKKNLPYYKLGGRVVYHQDDINEFLTGNKVEVNK